MGQNLELHVVFIWMGQAVGFGVINPFEPCVFRNRVILSTRLTCSVTLCTPLVSLNVLCVCVCLTPLYLPKRSRSGLLPKVGGMWWRMDVVWSVVSGVVGSRTILWPPRHPLERHPDKTPPTGWSKTSDPEGERVSEAH